jgi:membrane-associated phospholipid phosphatase
MHRGLRAAGRTGRALAVALFLVVPPTVVEAAEGQPSTASAQGPVAPPQGEQAERDSYEFQPGTICPFCVLTPQFAEGRSGLHWHGHWRPVGIREYVTIPLLGAAFLSLQFVPGPRAARWNEPILFDGAVRDGLRIQSSSGRRLAGDVSDAIFVVETLHPVVLDPLLVAWWQRQSPQVAWQMFVINAQAYAFSLLLNDVTKRLTARTRPWVGVGNCRQDASGEECGTDGRYRSFYSGHAAVTATGAGLICAHHTQLSLYQDPWLDGGTCALAVAGTAVTGAMRVASDNHWASDVVIGHLVGYVSGYLLPTLLYYKEFRTAPDEHTTMAPTFAALPMMDGESLGVALFAQF